MPDREQDIKLTNFVIAPNLREMIANGLANAPDVRIPVIISFQERHNKSNPDQRAEGQTAQQVAQQDAADEGITESKRIVKDFLEKANLHPHESQFYLFAKLRPRDILDLADKFPREIYQIWNDERVIAHLTQSTNTIKASACWRTFDARGKGITWAVLDTGINADHPHFKGRINQALSCSCVDEEPDINDKNGHGTHVAGIIAGKPEPLPGGKNYKWMWEMEGRAVPKILDMDECPSGVAPLADLVVVKVLDENGGGDSSAVIRGLEYLRQKNAESRGIKIDGANLSLGIPFNPKLYGCGHSPLCQEVTRAVRSGIVVVISCGNEGYGTVRISPTQEAAISFSMSISDPANADEAIAVGSVHKSAPHTYGVSYFSSKGPTSDGRMKPDLVAPGEKVVSCSHVIDQYQYKEMSGTSMAAPHVSGAIAAFLSVYKEYRGNPRAIKEILVKTATDLNRDRNVQGAGLLDLLRAITSV